ncbi:AbrB/MazE/SpoVT family DNA-binding domain-containing protein [Halopiger thermotolerans]
MPPERSVLIGRRTVIETGNSQGVTIPQEILADMDLKVGHEVTLVYDRENERVAVERAPESGGVF